MGHLTLPESMAAMDNTPQKEKGDAEIFLKWELNGGFLDYLSTTNRWSRTSCLSLCFHKFFGNFHLLYKYFKIQFKK